MSSGLCGWRPTNGLHACNGEPKWHGVVIIQDKVCAFHTSCDEHKLFLQGCASYIHPYIHPCGLPDTRFLVPDNICVLNWDPDVELASLLNSQVSDEQR